MAYKNANFLLTTMIAIATFNVNGLRDVGKAREIFSLFQNISLDIICLQETFWDNEFVEQYIQDMWPGEIFYNNCEDSPRKGVAILLSKKMIGRKNMMNVDDKGRLLKLQIDIDDRTLNIYNVYTPNIAVDRIAFLKTLIYDVKQDETNIILGDFNIAPNPLLDRSEGMQPGDKGSIEIFNTLLHESTTVDMWRYRYPDRRGYTRRQLVNNKLKQSRIDHILMSNSLLSYVQNTYIRMSTYSDHDMVISKLDITDIEKGPGLWIMNNSHLNDEDYTEQIKELILREKNNILKAENPLLWWDNLKYFIRKASQKYGQKCKRERMSTFYNIQNQLEKEYKKASGQQQSDLIRDLNEKLKEIEKYECKGAILRSKAFWAIEEDKCNKYFLGLEKYRQNNKIIKELFDEDGSIVSDTSNILKVEEQFYSCLYNFEQNDKNEEANILSHISNKLDDTTKMSIEENISNDELNDSIKKMSANKSPGPDGLTVEFYKKFWPQLCPILLEIYEEVFKSGILTNSMKRGVITLIYKNKGDRRNLKNWRPISLLNVDYKIIAKVLANRLKYVLQYIISQDQTCCVQGRDIAENIVALRDVIHYIENNRGLQGIILKVDQEKAFDRVSHSYMFHALEAFNFGPKFIRWIQIFYTDIQSAVKCNGFLTSYFDVKRSVRQGCPLSALLYCICAQPLNDMIRNNSKIVGITIPGSSCQSKIYQHADDSTFTIENVESCEQVMDVISSYCVASGAKVNCEKTEIMFLGKYRKSKPYISFKFIEMEKAMQILGIYLGHDRNTCINLNWNEKVKQIRSTTQQWKARHLTLRGKATVITSLIVSRIIYTLNVCKMPQQVEKQIRELYLQFLWDNKPPKINFYTMISDKRNGGLNIPDITLKRTAMRIKWVRKFFQNESIGYWKETMSYYLRLYGNMNLDTTIFELTQFDSRLMKLLPEFYREILQSWAYLFSGRTFSPQNVLDILKQPLFTNNRIVIDSKPLLFPKFIEAGIVKIDDIFYRTLPGFYSEKTIVQLVKETSPTMKEIEIYKKWNTLIEAIPKSWKIVLMKATQTDNMSLPSIVTDKGKEVSVIQFTTSFIYRTLVQRVRKEPISIRYWENAFPNTNYKDVYKNIHLSIKSPATVDLDYKLFNRIIYTRERLCELRIIDDSTCAVCKHANENLKHMFYECNELNNFLQYVKTIVDDILKVQINHIDYNFERCIFLGCFVKKTNINTDFCNFLLAIVRLSIYRRRVYAQQTGKIIDIKSLFKKILLNEMNYQWTYYKLNNNMNYIKDKFTKNIYFITTSGNNFTLEL